MTIQHFIRNYKELRIIVFLGIASFLFIIIIKGIVRPLHMEYSMVGTILQGVLPNFFAASGFSAFSFIYITFFLFKRKANNVISKAIFLSLTLPFLVLFIWEYLQFFIWQYPIDYQDIIASAFGSGIIVILLIFLTKEMRKNEYLKPL